MTKKPTLTSSFADIAQSPEMKKLLQESVLGDVNRAVAMANMINIQCRSAVEVVSFDYGHGNAYQEPGSRHWLPGMYMSDPGVTGDKEYTACGINSVGMVKDRCSPAKLTCDTCAAGFAAARLRQEE